MKSQNILKNKIFTLKTIASQAAQWKNEGKTLVFSNGCFDILHLGHVDYLSKAAALGDILIIGLNSDASVKKIKGKHRPINNEKSRTALLAALFFTNAVVVFDEDTPYNLINTIKPDILVKGKDYKQKDVVGYDIVTSYGGKVKTIKLVEGYSTTNIEEKIIASKQ